MKSANQNHFAVVPSVKTQRSRFSRPSELHTTFDAGYLIPIYLDEVIPGDTMSINVSHFARLATPLKPIMHNMYLDTFFFFVPNRLVWDNWVKLQGEQTDPEDSIDYTVPEMTATATTGYLEGSLHDYFGLPTKVPGYKHTCLPLRAYNLIYNQWFRPEDIIDSVVVDKDDADSDPTDYVLLRRAKRHDYFTACTPWPQKGDDVLLPLGDTAPIIGIGKYDGTFATQNQSVIETGGATVVYPRSTYIDAGVGSSTFYARGSGASNASPEIYADLTNATASTINALRLAFQTQRLLERDARSGTRYVEVLRAQYGVVSPDFRLQIPEYLGGSSQRINVTPIPQSSASGATGTTTPQGNLAAMGTTSGHCGFTKSFTEHGMIIGLVNVRADQTYQHGLDRYWSKVTRYDFYMPVFANLGEQSVPVKELYCQAPSVDTGSTGTPDNDKIFGWQERWAENRYKRSYVTGLFRSNASGTLHAWHLAQELSGLPSLDKTFIEENPPIDRCIAVPTEPHFLYDCYVDNQSTRPMPVYSVPGLIDHM